MLWLLAFLNFVAVLITFATTCYGLFVELMFRKAKNFMPELAFPEGYRFGFGHILEYIHYCHNPALMWEHTTKYCLYYKEGFFGMLGHQHWLFIPDHEVLQEVLSSHDETEKCYVYQAFDCITDGVFIAQDCRWRKLRKRLNLTFSGKQIDSYMSAVNNKFEVFLNNIVNKIALENKFVDIRPYVARYLLDVVSKTHFGADTHEQINNEYEFTDTTATVLEKLLEGRLLRPHLFNDFLFKRTQLFKEICKLRQKPFDMVNKLVKQRLKHNEENKEDTYGQLVYVDLVREVLEELNIPNTITNLQRNSGDLLVAGSDTTSVASSAVLYFLALYQDVQEKVYQEVSSIIGEYDGTYRPLTKSDLNSMYYLEMVINEALRWCAPMGIVRELKGNYNAGKYIIPKGSCLYCVMSSLHRNPEIYERPNEFFPDHFSPEAVKARPKSAFMPYSLGPRNCPGKAFANVLIKVIAAGVIYNYKLETDLALKDVKFKMILMTQHVQGYPIRFTPRHRQLDGTTDSFKYLIHTDG